MANVSLNTNVSSVSTGKYRYDNFGRRKDMLSSETSNLWGSSNSSSADKNVLSSLAGIKNAGSQLMDAVKALTGSASAFKDRVAVSSNTDAVAINKSSVPSSYASDMEINVKQLATAQENRSEAMTANETSGARAGTNKVAIEIDGKNTAYLDVKVTEGDTNREVQQKLADKINSSKLGLTASVEYNKETGESSLLIKANETGVAFKIRDVDTGAGTANGIVDATKAADISQAAQKAEYTVNNGATRTSASNTVDLGSGISATLKKVTEAGKPVTVNINGNTDKVTNAVKDLVKGYNELLSQANSGNASKLASQLTGAAKSYSAALSRAGISMDKDGKLSVDSDKLKKAAEDGSLERALGSNSGFVNRMDQISKKAEKNPGTYVESKTSSVSTNEDYLNNLSFKALYQPRFGTNYSSVSMLLDMFI